MKSVRSLGRSSLERAEGPRGPAHRRCCWSSEDRRSGRKVAVLVGRRRAAGAWSEFVFVNVLVRRRSFRACGRRAAFMEGAGLWMQSRPLLCVLCFSHPPSHFVTHIGERQEPAGFGNWDFEFRGISPIAFSIHGCGLWSGSVWGQ